MNNSILNLPSWLDFDFIHYEFNSNTDCFELIIGVFDTNNKWKIIFENPVGFRSHDETDMCIFYENQNIPNKCGVFLLDESEYANWFLKNSIFQKKDDGKSYIVKTEDVIIEVLSGKIPSVINVGNSIKNNKRHA